MKSMNRFFSMIGIAALVASAATSYALDATVAWNPTTEGVSGAPLPLDVTSYRLYYGTSSGNYDQSVLVDGDTAVNVAGLANSTTYYFAVKALYGNDESALSSEMSWTTPDAPDTGGTGDGGSTTPPPAEPSALRIETILTDPAEPALVNSQILAAGSFVDPDTGDTHIAEWSWGDGSTSAGDVSETDQIVLGDHAYSTVGVYPITLGVMDASGSTDVAEALQYAVVYDPQGTYVAGSGWIDSPVGAYAADPALGGVARFGIVTSYKKQGKNSSFGATEIRFQIGDLDVHSTQCDQLTVKGKSGNAQISGIGTINGTLDCQFSILAGDSSSDSLQISIWITDANGVDILVYDNGSEQAISGGAILVGN